MKGVAVPYIIAIVIFVIIAAVVIILVYTVIKGGEWNCTKCRTQFTVWCSDCYLIDQGTTITPEGGTTSPWIGGATLGNDLYECVKSCGYWPTASGAGQTCDDAEYPCKSVIVY